MRRLAGVVCGQSCGWIRRQAYVVLLRVEQALEQGDERLCHGHAKAWSKNRCAGICSRFRAIGRWDSTIYAIVRNAEREIRAFAWPASLSSWRA
jgi:hypothetical protein